MLCARAYCCPSWGLYPGIVRIRPGETCRRTTTKKKGNCGHTWTHICHVIYAQWREPRKTCQPSSGGWLRREKSAIVPCRRIYSYCGGGQLIAGSPVVFGPLDHRNPSVRHIDHVSDVLSPLFAAEPVRLTPRNGSSLFYTLPYVRFTYRLYVPLFVCAKLTICHLQHRLTGLSALHRRPRVTRGRHTSRNGLTAAVSDRVWTHTITHRRILSNTHIFARTHFFSDLPTTRIDTSCRRYWVTPSTSYVLLSYTYTVYSSVYKLYLVRGVLLLSIFFIWP